MYGEPSAWEYAKAMDLANKNISTNGFRCMHNLAGWNGYIITTPKGNSYHLVHIRLYKELGTKEYELCEYTSTPFTRGKPLGIYFHDLEDCKEYLLEIE